MQKDDPMSWQESAELIMDTIISAGVCFDNSIVCDVEITFLIITSADIHTSDKPVTRLIK